MSYKPQTLVRGRLTDENLLSKEAKNNILEWNHPEMAKQTDPTDDL